VGFMRFFFHLMATKSVKAKQNWLRKRNGLCRSFWLPSRLKTIWTAELTTLPLLQEYIGGDRGAHQVSAISNAEFSRDRLVKWRMATRNCPL
jgi:hypothetical protein